MAPRLIVSRRAEREAGEAYEWYEEQPVAGFQIGDRIQIAITPGRLVIIHAKTLASNS
jgi:hypothetical protein